MEYNIDASGEKRLIKKISLAIVIVILIGLILIFFNNITFIYKTNINKLSNNFIDSFCDEIDSIKQYTKTSYSDTKIKYNDATELNIYMNRNEGNQYNILKINDKVEIYEKEGLYYLNIPEIQNTIRLNKDESIDLVDILNNIQTKDIKKIYKKFSKSIVSQLNGSDFYKVRYSYTNERGREVKAYKYVFEINQQRAKNILINALNDILKEEKFLLKTDMVLKDITNNEDISSKEILENIIENIKKYEVNENIKYEIATTNSGLFSLNIDTFEITCLDKNIIISEIKGDIEKNNINITMNNNINNENGTINIKTDKDNSSIIMKYTDKENNVYDFEYKKEDGSSKDKNILTFKYKDIEINSDITLLKESKSGGIMSIINKEEAVEENQEQNDIEGKFEIKIGEKQYKYEITSVITKEDKKEEVILDDILKINNLTNEQLGLIGGYFELTAEEIREIVGETDPTAPIIPSTPGQTGTPGGNLAIPPTQTETPNTEESIQPSEPVKPQTNLAI